MRCNIYGGPGSGKSTTAAWLFSELKFRNKSIELCSEFCKSWSYQNRKINGFDQVYIFGKQMNYEYRFLNSGVKNIITDSPTLLSYVYTDLYFPELNISSSIYKINQEYDKEHDCFNIFLIRGDKPYVKEGRNQTFDEAKEIDGLIWDNLKYTYPKEKILTASYLEKDIILKKVLEVID